MTTQQDIVQSLDVKFRVLIIGRANAGKTSILQRVCDTTESPEIYRLGPGGDRYQVQLDPTIERGQHEINDELIFTNHDGYIFYDSRGFEAGGKGELETVQEFVKRKSQGKRLRDRLHAIWYCVPMDNDRPSLDLKYFEAICPDKNVPVMAVFTKFDQFKRDIKMKLEDEGRDPEIHLNAEVENIFNQHYLAKLNGPPPFIRLEKMQKHEQRCAGLIEMTANALSDSAVTLMLVAVQRDNLELNIKQVIRRAHHDVGQRDGSTGAIITTCIVFFPSLWYWEREEEEFFEESSFFESREFSLEFFRELRSELGKILISKLQSFTSNPPPSLCISSDNTHHTMIVAILILDRASILYASPSHPTATDALDQACSQYISSDTHNAVKEQFSQPPTRYSISQITKFVLSHRL